MADHYVTKSLTKPWEFSSRKLRYFDFINLQFGIASSEDLFAENDLNSTRLETFFNRRIETIVAQERQSIFASQDCKLPWKKYKAFCLLLLLQPSRAMSRFRVINSLELLPRWTQSAMDRLVHELMMNYQLIRGCVPADCALFYPSTGTFPFWFTSRHSCGGYEDIRWGIALPLHPRAFIAIVPKGVSEQDLDVMFKSATMTNLSLGSTLFCDRVVIPPCLWHEGDQTLIREQLISRRLENEDMRILFNTLESAGNLQ